MNKDTIKNIFIGAFGAGFIVMLILHFSERRQPVYAPAVQPSGAGKAPTPYHENQVKNTIIKHRSDISKCYTAFINTNPKVTDGMVKVDFEIDDDGEVIRVEKVMASLGTDVLYNCITAEIKTWKFPQPDIPAPVYASHVFRFKKAADQPGLQNKMNTNIPVKQK